MKEAQLTKLLDEKVDIYINNIAKERKLIAEPE